MANKGVIQVDAHVHIYDCFDICKFFNSGLENFELLSSQLDSGIETQAVLLLTESSQNNYFSKLKQIAEKDRLLGENWSLLTTQEECSIYACKSADRGLFVIAGSQIVTSEDLEVLALMTSHRFQDGMSFNETLASVSEHGGVSVVPWGFGKWLGRRGKIVNQFLDKQTYPYLFLGDNSGRPVFWRYSPLFENAKAVGIKILPGTDPLPFSREAIRPGKFGFRLDGYLDPERPAETLKRILLDINTQPMAYGKLESPLTFIQNQVAMQLLKRSKKNESTAAK